MLTSIVRFMKLQDLRSPVSLESLQIADRKII